MALPRMPRNLPADRRAALAQVTVQAGARVQAVADQLRQHGLTLQNYASIREQTVGGFIQVRVLAAGGLAAWLVAWLVGQEKLGCAAHQAKILYAPAAAGQRPRHRRRHPARG